jgi:hypothetical protein
VRRYFVNLYPEPDGRHEVHREGCTRMPASPLYLGYHPDCRAAIAAAKRFYPRPNGCFQCARVCHTQQR